MARGFGGRGGFGNFADMARLAKQVQQVQADMAKAQEELEAARVEATSGGGAVKAIVSGKGKLIALEISPDAVDPEDVEMLQDLIVSAVREAEEAAEKAAEERMQGIAGGIGLPPGLF